MDSKELRKKFLDFFEKRGHKIVPSFSLIPDDSTVLLTTAGMQQFVSYLAGEKDALEYFKVRHLISVQKCFRTPDIEEVGDDTHHTFFEMLGSWSIGEDDKKGYFKEGAIQLAIDFFNGELGLDKKKFYITIFKGDGEISRDDESFKIWQEQGISKERIYEFGADDNFWGPTTKTGPCGPCSEIYYDRGEKYGCGDKNCGPNCKKCKRFVELWNLVFMEYNKNIDGSFTKLPQRNVDTGAGLERVLAVLQNKNSAFETDLFLPIIKKIEELSGIKYEDKEIEFRIIADHIRGAVFLISEGILPSNIDRGYILRRILRRAMRHGKILNLSNNFLISLAQKVIENYKDIYPEIKQKENDVLVAIQKEEEKFEQTLEIGLKEFDKTVRLTMGWPESREEFQSKIILTGDKVFKLFSTYGFPLELIREEASKKKIVIDESGFQEELKKHQKISRVGSEKKFGGGGKFSPELHTATHLLQAALREVLGDDVKQMGSDIAPERLRFDFSYPQKMTPEQKQEVEDLINKNIKEGLEVKKEEMSYEDAISSGALAFFKERYPSRVSVYTILNLKTEEIFSKEICRGPHIENLKNIGEFKIKKEESSGAGIRRIKATLE